MKNISKKISLSLFIAFSAVLLMACGANTPEKTAGEFLDNYKALNIEKMSEYVSDDVKDSLKEELPVDTEELDAEESEEISEELLASIGRYAKELEYEVIDVELNEDKDKAELNINFVYADGSKVIMTSVGEIFGELMGLAFSGQETSDEEVNDLYSKVLVRNLDENEITKESSSGVISLEKQDKEWVITEVDENAMNVLTIGLVQGLEDWNPFGEMESEDEGFELELDLEDAEVEAN